MNENDVYNLHFIDNLIRLLGEFREWQEVNKEPYDYDLLGFMQWLEECKGLKVS